MFSLFVGFLIGAVAVILAEGLALFFFLDRLRRRKGQSKTEELQVGRDVDVEQSLNFLQNKKGVVWVLESEKVSLKESQMKLPAEQRNKKEIVEVFPIKKYAKIKDQLLILRDCGGFQETIQLVGCEIVAVSASSLSSRKWAKRYPIKVENKKAAIYNGSKTFCIYAETSWEKESWCKALHFASCTDKDKVNWIKLSEEFHLYLSALNEEYPSFMKPSSGFGEPIDRGIKIDGSSSKVRHFLKRLAKKASKSGADHKPSAASSLSRDERKVGEKLQATQDRTSATGLLKSSSVKTVKSFSEEDLPWSLKHSSSHGQLSILSDADGDEKLGNDDGTLCWNLFFSRLFFDARRNTAINDSIQARIQRTLSNMRTPSYIGGITCTRIDLGKLPPYIHNMRVLPMDMKEVWSAEVDIEYCGGAILDIETRLEVREPDFQKGIVNTSMEPSTAGEATSDLLEGFEHYGDQLNLPRNTADITEQRDEGDELDGLKKSTSWKSTYMSRWKTVLNSLANQVSQVPLSLAIRVTSLRGTIRLHIKPPPSDSVWCGFTSMPDIEWNLESSLGEHKITNSHIALLLSNRFKTAIRETMVLPNCESIYIPWMLAEKDDWVPRKVAPFIWVHQESGESSGQSASNCQPGETKMKSSTMKESKFGSDEHPDDDHEKLRNVIYPQPTPPTKCSSEPASSSQSVPIISGSNDQSVHSDQMDDLRVPLLQSGDMQGSFFTTKVESPEQTAGEGTVAEERPPFGDDLKPKKIWRRARMMDLGKKMGDKLEEKRRQIEEKGRHIVEKMRTDFAGT